MVELRLLGEVAVHVDGRPVDLGPARQRCVWAALAVDVNRVVPVERLSERVWGGNPPLRARAILTTYLSRLRQALPEDDAVSLARRSGGYLLQADESAVDLCRFRELRALARASTDDDHRAAELLTGALGLWRGEALTGPDSEWAAAERDRLRRERLDTACDLVDARLRLGHGDDLVAELVARTAEHPLDERVAAQYLLALHRAGRSAEALEHFRVVRERLADELGTDPGAALRHLHRQVLADDPTLAGRPAHVAGRGTDRVVVPRQLPVPRTAFVGRRDELDRLDGTFDAGGTVVISAIAGAGGIGKTWLALHWANTRLDRYPDGQLFADLRGFSPDSAPMAPATALRGFLSTLGVEPGSIPADPHAQAALFRSLTAGKRMLVVLDNAVDTDQVVPLLPGGEGCAVVVTSRNRLAGLVTGYGARRLDLDVLTDAEARDLLAGRLGEDRVEAERAAVDELVGLCGGVPLALSIVAARGEAPLAEVVAELHESGLDGLDDDDPAASLPTVLSWSCHALTDEQATAFGLLAVAPGPDTSLAAAVNLTGLTPVRTRAVLRGLEQASLLERDPAGRYRMHDLVRRYATETAHRDLAEDVREAALRRVVDFYLHTAHTADRLLRPHHEPSVNGTTAEPDHRLDGLADHTAALTWFDAEHACLRAAQRTAAECGGHRAAWHLAATLTTYYRGQGRFRDAVAMWRAVLASADQLDDPAVHIEAHRNLGAAYAPLGRHEEALDHLRRALALTEQTGDPGAGFQVHRALSNAWTQHGDDRRALDHATRALDVCRVLDDPVWEGHLLNQVGWLTARLGDHERAREHCLAALALAREHHDPDCQATTLDSLGYIDHHTGHHARSVRHYREALALFHDLGDLYMAAETLDYLGHPHLALGEVEEARVAWREALALYRAQQRDEAARRVRRRVDDLDRSPGLDRSPDPDRR
ncbi:BTAD domain-containing putative transcriptional regulator [Saccharothrix sp. Mg75]|uniref:AfsR/SARP family transcriptional regulator n=1 Tax=Saccharothrix sp. Mg75 TaxID=3445357 RepID=UPI003EE91B8F